jgi:hypothetical protein
MTRHNLWYRTMRRKETDRFYPLGKLEDRGFNLIQIKVQPVVGVLSMVERTLRVQVIRIYLSFIYI